jgi:ABC-type multidrug transport system permease subunit
MSTQKAGSIKKEPIKYPWIWIALVGIILLMVPWYFPKNAVNPVIFGFPLWAFVSLVMAGVLSAFLSYILKNYWILEDEGEED